MNKRLVYICSNEAKSGNCSQGVISKINCQVCQFKAVGYDTFIQAPKPKYALGKLDIYNPFSSIMDWSCVRHRNNVDAVYIRLVRIDLPFLKLLAEIRRKNRNVKILFEFPTYPYKGEMPAFHGRVLYCRDRFYSNFLKYYVDYIVMPATGYGRLFGIDVLYVPNGVAYEDVPVVSKKTQDGSIHLLAVASMCIWHGYDRLIRGLGEYYETDGRVKVVLHLAGSGPELKRYQRLVRKYHLEEYVFFEGFCEGEKLNELYEKCQIGVGSLGVHRTWDGKVISSLKLKEYALKGLPFVLEGHCDMESRETSRYILRVPQDETAIDIRRMIRFYHKNYDGNASLNSEIKERFRDFYDMEKLFKPVTDFLGS